MAKEENKTFCYIKVFTDFFTNDTIDFIMSQENGSQYVALYLMLVLKTVNNGFALEKQIGEIIIPYDVKQIAKASKYFDVDTVAVALDLFKRLGIIYESDENGTLKLAKCGIDVGNWMSMTPEAIRQRNKRERDNLSQNSNGECNAIVTKSTEYRVQSTEDKSTDEKRKRVQSTDKDNTCDFEKITQMYSEICTSLPQIKLLSDKRKKLIKAIDKKFSLADIQTVFEKTEESDFLTGRSGDWACNFDWLMNANNFVKVLEGNYDNKDKTTRNNGNPNETRSQRLAREIESW